MSAVPKARPKLPYYHQSFTARNFNSSPLAIPLKGDVYDYTFEVVLNNGPDNTFLYARLNSDTGSNYRNYYMRGGSSTASGGVNDTSSVIPVGFSNTEPTTSLMCLTGKSGDERYIDVLHSAQSTTARYIYKSSNHWTNTADAVDEITFLFTASNTCDLTLTIYETPKNNKENWALIQQGSVNQNLNTTPFDISNLDGDADDQYYLQIRNLNTSNTTGNLYLRLNADGATNYIAEWLRNASGSLSSNNYSSFWAGMYIEDNNTNNTNIDYIINAKSGQKRSIKETQVTISGNDDQLEKYVTWSNTGDNLTSLRFYKTSSDTVTFDWKLYKKKNPSTVADRFLLPLKLSPDGIRSVNGDFSSGETFSNLNGNGTSIIKLEGLFSTIGTELRVQCAGDTGANYDEQELKASTSTVSATSSTGNNYWVICDASSSKVAGFELYIFPKDGDNRPAMAVIYHNENTIEYKYFLWNDTTTDLDSLKVYGSSTTTTTGIIKCSRIPLAE